jgi:hypothetical protein
VDSVVVDKTDFLRAYPLSEDLGTLILSKRGDIVQYQTQLNGMVLQPEGTDSTDLQIVRYYQEEGHLTEGTIIEGLGIDGDINYPFLMPDGQTFYFAARSENGYGNYDLYATRYDSDSKRFYQAENMGFPYNSYANDYMLVIDETVNLGWFASDRYQPAGKVCIYVFIPNTTRKIYASENYSEEKMRSLARIDRIADSWGDKALRNEALDRFYAARKQQSQATAANAQASPLQVMRHQAETLENALQLARNYYARASKAERQNLRHEILSSEKELEALQLEIRKEEKKQNAILYKDNN